MDPTQIVTNYLSKLHLNASREWVGACVQFCREQGSNTNPALIKGQYKGISMTCVI